MKTKAVANNTVDDNGFGLALIPTMYIGWENYKYQKVIQLYTHFLVWELLLEFHWK